MHGKIPRGRLIKIIKFYASTDKNDVNKLICHFIKKTYGYDGELISDEKEREYNIVNAFVLVDKKWQPIGIEEQKKLAWKKFNEDVETPIKEIEKKYAYSTDKLTLKRSNTVSPIELKILRWSKFEKL